MTKVADLIGGDDEVFLKEAIGEYSKLGTNGAAFNPFLRKAQFLKKLSSPGSRLSSDAIKTFGKRFAQASEYFERHLTDKEYTVYRGMGSSGLKALLDKSNPKISYKTDDEYHKLIIDDDLIRNINRIKPIVFDEGLVSTSLNKSISSCCFHGYRGRKCAFYNKNS